MKTRQITISTESLNLNYEDDLTIDLIEDYVLEELEVPTEYIKSLNIHDNYVDIKLDFTQSHESDDWFVNLQRVA